MASALPPTGHERPFPADRLIVSKTGWARSCAGLDDDVHGLAPRYDRFVYTLLPQGG